MENKILVLFAHPAIHKSRVNRRLIKVYNEFENITFRDLYDIYPQFMIDVQYEQRLLLENDIIIMHHPFYWYSAPPIIKQWMDLVLERGFAFGNEGAGLKGKYLFSIITTGRDRDAYSATNSQNLSIRKFLLPFEQVALFCGMKYLPPFVVHRIMLMKGQTVLQSYVKDLRQILDSLAKPDFDFVSISTHEYMNSDMNAFYLDTPEAPDAS